MKTCNSNGYCLYRLTNLECSYQNYCDYQTPRDSRPIRPLPLVCNCKQTCSLPCPYTEMVYEKK